MKKETTGEGRGQLTKRKDKSKKGGRLHCSISTKGGGTKSKRRDKNTRKKGRERRGLSKKRRRHWNTATLWFWPTPHYFMYMERDRRRMSTLARLFLWLCKGEEIHSKGEEIHSKGEVELKKRGAHSPTRRSTIKRNQRKRVLSPSEIKRSRNGKSKGDPYSRLVKPSMPHALAIPYTL